MSSSLSKEDNLKFEVNLGYIARPYLENGEFLVEFLL
jgi:hypothetical protein